MLDAFTDQANDPVRDLGRKAREAVDGIVSTAARSLDMGIRALKALGRSDEAIAGTRSLTVDAVVASVASVTELVDECLEELDCPMKVQMQVDVAIDEVMANVCSYAYEDGVGKVSVLVETVEDGEAVRITFVDSGVPFDPLERPAPDTTLPLNERGIGGYGIFIVRQTMDDVSYVRLGEYNVLSLVKRIAV